MFPKAPEIKTSINYDLFKKIEWNRAINKSNLKKLVEENGITFQLHKFPILVTSDMKILDGQHRFEVSKHLGSPVYYIVDNELDESIKSVHSVNKAGLRHSRRDKLEMYYRAGDPEAAFVYKAHALYQYKFDLTSIFTVLCTGTEGGNATTNIDKYGKIVLNNKEMGMEVLDALYYSGLSDKFRPMVTLALSMVVNKSGIHPKAILKRVELNMAKWISPKSRTDAMRSFLTCYNYGLKTNRIAITGYKV